MLAGMRTDAPNGSRQRDFFLDNLHSTVKIALCNFLDIALTVCTGRTVELARTAAVAGVVAHQQFQRDLPRLVDARSIEPDDIAVHGLCRAGAQQLRERSASAVVKYLNGTEPAGAVNADAFVIESIAWMKW